MYIRVTYILLQFFHLLAVNWKYIFIATNIMTLHFIFILFFITDLRKENNITWEMWIYQIFVTNYEIITHIIELLQYTVHLEFGSVTVIDAESPWFLIISFIYFLEKAKQRHVSNKSTIWDKLGLFQERFV